MAKSNRKSVGNRRSERRIRMAIVMQNAWMFVREDGMALSDAIRIANLNYRLRTMLFSGHARFVYVKANGETREAVGTLCGGVFDNSEPRGTGASRTKSNQLYFDDEFNGFRQFRKSRLVAVIGMAA